MRSSEKPASLGELMGGKASQAKEMSLEDLPELLGEKMPELPKNRIGKFRLIGALQQRFGNGYMNIPMIKNIVKQFDDEVELENTIRMNKKGRE